MPCQFSPQKRLIRCARTMAFGKPNLGSAERLADAIGFTDRVGVDQGHRQAARMSKGEHGLVEVREAGNDGAAVPAAADHQDPNRPFQ